MLASLKSGSMKDSTSGIRDGLVAITGNLDGDSMVAKSTQLMSQKFKPAEGQIRNIRRDALKQEISLLEIKTSILARSLNNNNERNDDGVNVMSSCLPFDVVDAHRTFVDSMRQSSMMRREFKSINKNTTNENIALSPEKISPPKRNQEKQRATNRALSERVLVKKISKSTIQPQQKQQNDRDINILSSDDDCDKDNNTNNNHMIVSKRSMIMKSNSKRIISQNSSRALEILNNHSSKLSAESTALLSNLFLSSPTKNTPKRQASRRRIYSTKSSSNITSSSLDHDDERITPKETTSYITPTTFAHLNDDLSSPNQKIELPLSRTASIGGSSRNLLKNSSHNYKNDKSPSKKSEARTSSTGGSSTRNLFNNNISHKNGSRNNKNDIKGPKYDDISSTNLLKNSSHHNDNTKVVSKSSLNHESNKLTKLKSPCKVRNRSKIVEDEIHFNPKTDDDHTKTPRSLRDNSNHESSSKEVSKCKSPIGKTERRSMDEIHFDPEKKNPTYNHNDDNDCTKTPKSLRDSNHEASSSKSVTKHKSPNGKQSDGECNDDDCTKTPKSILRDNNHESTSSNKKSITKYKSPNGRSAEGTRRRSKEERPPDEDEIHSDPTNRPHDDDTTKTPRKSRDTNREADNKLPKDKSPNGRSQQEQRNRLMKDIKGIEQQDEIRFDPASMTATTTAMSDDIDNNVISGSLRKKNQKSKSQRLSVDYGITTHKIHDDKTDSKPNEMKLPFDAKIKSQQRSRTISLSDANNDNEEETKKDPIEIRDIKKQKGFKKSQNQQQSTSLSKRLAENADKKKSIDHETFSQSGASVSTTKSAKSKRSTMSVGGGLDGNKSKATTMLMVISSPRKMSMSPSRRELSPGRNVSKSSQNKASNNVVRKVHSHRAFSNSCSNIRSDLVFPMNDDNDEDNINEYQVGGTNTYTDYDDTDNFDPTEWNPTDDNQIEEFSEAFYVETSPQKNRNDNRNVTSSTIKNGKKS